MSGYDEERLAELIAALPPAPEDYVQAAQELPLARRGLDSLVARADADADFRRSLVCDLEAAIAAVGLEPEPRLVAALRERLSL